MDLDEALLRNYRALDPTGAFLRQVVETFRLRSMPTVDALEDALAARDAAGVAAASHQFRGAAGTVGLTEVTRLCAALEALANTGSLEGAPALLSDCRRALAQGVQQLERFVGQRAAG